jgi:hypothetical protein
MYFVQEILSYFKSDTLLGMIRQDTKKRLQIGHLKGFKFKNPSVKWIKGAVAGVIQIETENYGYMVLPTFGSISIKN